MAQGKRMTPQQRELYWDSRGAGLTQKDSALKAGIGESAAYRLEKERKSRRPTDEKGRLMAQRDPLTPSELGRDAKRALEDFGYFQKRYLGRIPYYWQEKSAAQIQELLESPDKEYLVINVAPGTGKTTMYTHDLPCWLTVRNRRIRGMMGAAVTTSAKKYTNRLRRTLATTLPIKNDDEQIRKGLALDATAVLSEDFGRFRSVDDTWTADQFVVQQFEDMGAITEKEATWSAYGADASFIGGRFDIVIWDDLVDPKKQRTMEAREELQNYWDDVSEPRLEPGGLLILQGQRFGADDLYRYCLNKMVGEDVDFATGIVEEAHRKYHHIIYKAHYEDKCLGPASHGKDAPAYPDGCLLSPWRLPWKEINIQKTNSPGRFEVVYQQQDTDPAGVLVQKDWVYGDNGHPGCVDKERDILELPKGPDGHTSLTGDLVSVMTVDPSPTKFWAVQWWLFQPSTEFRWLMDLERTPMEADEFLDFNHSKQQFTGLLEDWVVRSNEMGYPVSHCVVENNAAQRFLLQYDHVRRWMALRGVEIIAHSTHRNKSDHEYGVETIRQHYQFGRVRLPYKRNSEGWYKSQRLIDEVTTYPHGRTDDQVMAHWFLEWNLPNIYSPELGSGKMWRPSWVSEVPSLRRGNNVESGAAAMMSRAVGAVR